MPALEVASGCTGPVDRQLPQGPTFGDLPSEPLATILMYHGIPRYSTNAEKLNAETFEAQVVWLRKHCDIVNQKQPNSERGGFARPRILITFDDGFRNNWEVAVPILRRHGAAATFFASSRHCTPGEYLWFVYLRALRDHFKGNGFNFCGEFQDMSDHFRDATLRRLFYALLALRPHPSAMYQAIKNELPLVEDFVELSDILSEYAGMTAEQIGELSADPLFSIGVHTVDHPLLSECNSEEAKRQITRNRAWLEATSGQKCEWIAYPGGDYKQETLAICADAGLSGGFAVNPKFGSRSGWEMPRVGIYSSSLGVFAAKAALGRVLTTSWWQWAYGFVHRASGHFEI